MPVKIGDGFVEYEVSHHIEQRMTQLQEMVKECNTGAELKLMPGEHSEVRIVR